MLGVEPAFDDEKRFERQIRDRAEHHDWMAMKVGKTPVVSRGKKFWITATSLKGWPDIVAIHPSGYLLFLEVKGVNGSASPEQKVVMAALQAVCARCPDHMAAAIVKPRDWPIVEKWLARPGVAAPA
jgi:hypothetical protein